MHTNMHINSNSSPPFCQSSTKGLKTKQNLIKTYSSPLFVQNKESIKGQIKMIPIKNVSMKCILIPIKSETIPIEKQKS